MMKNGENPYSFYLPEEEYAYAFFTAGWKRTYKVYVYPVITRLAESCCVIIYKWRYL